MTLRNYTNTSVETTLLAGISPVDVSLTVVDATGYPAAPFAIVVDPDVVASEEVLLVTTKVGPVFTITRGYDGTTGTAHSAGATVIHAAIAADFTEALYPYTYATGTLTIAVQPTPGDTITVGALTYTYVPDGFAFPDEISIGVDLAEAQVNTIFGINQGIGATLPTAGIVSFVVDVSTVSAGVPGTAGNGIVTTSVFTDGANFFGQSALSGGTDGSDSGHIQAQTMELTAASPASTMLRLQTAPGQDETEVNIFEVLDADTSPIMKIDGGGAVYFLRDLRMVDPTNASNFVVRSDGQTYIRAPDIDDAFRVQVRGTIPGINDILVFALRPRTNVTAVIQSAGAGSVALEIDTNGLDDDTDLIKAYGTSNFDVVFRLLDRGAVVIAQHAAPDDSLLNAGDMSLWFDQTNGAAQFMIKAKTADGTVVIGAVPLA